MEFFLKILIQIEYINPFFDISLYVTLNKTIPNEYTGVFIDSFYLSEYITGAQWACLYWPL